MGLSEFGPKGGFVYFDLAVVILAIFANCFVLIALVRSKMNVLGYRRFLMSLAMCDLYSCVVNLSTVAYQLSMVLFTKPPAFMHCGANVLKTLQLAGFFTNLLNLGAMSIDQFLGVIYPVSYRKNRSDRATKIGVIAIWIMAFSFAFLDIPINIFIYQTRQEDSDQKTHIPPPQPPSPSDIETKDNFGTAMFVNPQFPNLPLYKTRAKRTNLGEILFMKPYYLSSHEANSDLLKPTKLPDISLWRSHSIPNRRHNGFQNGTGAPLPPFPFPSMKPFSIQSIDNDDAKAMKSKLMIDRIIALLRKEDAENESKTREEACTFFSVKKFWFEICVFVTVLLCFTFLIICYGIIFRKVFKKVDSSGRRAKRLAVTTVLFLGTFAIW